MASGRCFGRNIQKDLHVPGSLQHRDMQVLISVYIVSCLARISAIRSAGGRHCHRNRQLGSCSIQLIASNSDGADSCPPYTSTRGLSLRARGFQDCTLPGLRSCVRCPTHPSRR